METPLLSVKDTNREFHIQNTKFFDQAMSLTEVCPNQCNPNMRDWDAQSSHVGRRLLVKYKQIICNQVKDKVNDFAWSGSTGLCCWHWNSIVENPYKLTPSSMSIATNPSTELQDEMRYPRPDTYYQYLEKVNN